MLNGKTIWDIFSNKHDEVLVENTIYNPLHAKIGSHVVIADIHIDGIELTNNELWKISEIWSWQRKINNNTHPMVDYIIESDGKSLILRILPNEQSKYHVLILSQYYPETPGPMEWNEESPYVLESLNDTTGELYRFEGTPNEEKYSRIGANLPISADVKILRDLDHNNKISDNEINTEQYTLWDYYRIIDEKITQFLYVQLSGKYVKPNKINGGDKSILMLRGEEVDPNQVTIL